MYLATFFSKNSLWAKTTKMIKSDPKARFFQYFETFCNWLEMSTNKNWYCYLPYCTKPVSGKILALKLAWKAFNQLVYRMLWSQIPPVWMARSQIPPVWMARSHWFFAWWQTARIGKKFN